jgi:hypothetical protein
VADKKNPDVPPIPVPPVEAAPKVAKAPAAAKAATKPAATKPAAAKAAPAAKPIPPLVDLAGGSSAPAAVQPNPYAQPAPAAPPANPYAHAAPAQPQPYNYGPYVPQPPQGLSITSMVLGIVGLLLSFFGSGFLLNVAAVITGHLASKRQPYAKPFWLTGIITGYIGVGFALLWGAIILGLFLLGIASSSYY